MRIGCWINVLRFLGRRRRVPFSILNLLPKMLVILPSSKPASTSLKFQLKGIPVIKDLHNNCSIDSDLLLLNLNHPSQDQKSHMVLSQWANKRIKNPLLRIWRSTKSKMLKWCADRILSKEMSWLGDWMRRIVFRKTNPSSTTSVEYNFLRKTRRGYSRISSCNLGWGFLTSERKNSLNRQLHYWKIRSAFSWMQSWQKRRYCWGKTKR